MTIIATLLTEGFADWETAMLNAAARGFYGVETRFASPGGHAVTSMGGLKVQPEMTFETLDLEAIDALVISGGLIWKTPDAPAIGQAVRKAHARGKVVAAICDGTLALARTGLLDTVAHTSNGAGYLDESGYGGAALYRDVPGAVRDQRVVTAPATAPATFMAAVLAELGRADDQLAYYVGLYGAEHGAGVKPAA